MKSSQVMLFVGALVSLPVWAQSTAVTTPSRGNTDIVVWRTAQCDLGR